MSVRVSFDLRGDPTFEYACQHCGVKECAEVEIDPLFGMCRDVYACADRRAKMLGPIILPGWTCPSCRAFNGSMRQLLAACRCCGTWRPGVARTNAP